MTRSGFLSGLPCPAPLVLIAIGCLSGPLMAADRYVCYVSLSGENRLAIYNMDPETGALDSLGHFDLDGAPGSLAALPGRKLLYASVRSSKKVAALRIDPTGRLSLLKSTPVVDGPVYITPDRTGAAFLLTSYYGSHKIAIYPIQKEGEISENPTQILSAEKNPHSLQVDRSNQFVFVPNTGANLIQQFTFDRNSGLLNPNGTPQVETPANTGPRHIFFHPSRNYVYFCNEQGSSVTGYRLDPAKGTLAAIQTLPTLPADFKENNSCADVEITPDGRFLYVSNRGHDSLAGYTINQDSGELTSIGQFPTEQTPREFAIDPTGRFVYSAGQGNGRLRSYRIDQKTGQLESFHEMEVGKSPAWVSVIRLAE